MSTIFIGIKQPKETKMQKLTIGIYPLFIEFDSKSLRIHDVIYRNDSVRRETMLIMYAKKLQGLEKRLANLQSKSFLTQYEEHGIEVLKQKIQDLKTAISVIKVFVQKEPKEEVHVVKTTETFTTTFHQVSKTPVVEPKPQTKFSYVDLCKAIFGGQTDAHKKRSVITAIQEILENVEDVVLKERFCFKGNGKLKVLYINNEDWALQKIVDILRKKLGMQWKAKHLVYKSLYEQLKISQKEFDVILQDEKFKDEYFIVKDKTTCTYINKKCIDDIINAYLERRAELSAKATEPKPKSNCGRKPIILHEATALPEIEESAYLPRIDFCGKHDVVARSLNKQLVRKEIVNYSAMPAKMNELTKMIQTLLLRCQDWYDECHAEICNEKRKERIKNIILNLANDLGGQSEYFKRCWQLNVMPLVEKFKQGDFMSVEEVKEFFAPVFAAPRIQSAKPVYIR